MKSYPVFNAFIKDESGNYVFKEYQSQHVAAGDSVSKDMIIPVNGVQIPVEWLFQEVHTTIDGKEYFFPEGLLTSTVDENLHLCARPIKSIMRHKVNKRMFRCYVNKQIASNWYVDVTNDHSLIRHSKGGMEEVKPTQIEDDDLFVLYKVRDKEILAFDHILSVEEIEYDDYVYDLEVEDTHVFFANGVLVHNTDSLYLDVNEFVEGKDTDSIIKFADAIPEKINQEFPDFLKNVFNIPKENQPIMNTEREIVSDKSYFLTKKRYIMHVVDKEGKRVDEHKTMGLEIIKSDTPKVIQNFLMDLCLAIMDGYTYNQIHDLISRFKDQYMQKTILDVGRPMSVKVLADYEQEYNRTGSMKGFPYHVRASLFYNSKCSHRDRKIRSGDKIRVCYINHPESKYIAVPSDLINPPDFIHEIEVDWKKQWETVEKKIENYLEPINMDKQSIRENTRKSLFGT